jgi:hypothetical protein
MLQTNLDAHVFPVVHNLRHSKLLQVSEYGPCSGTARRTYLCRYVHQLSKIK